MSEEDFNCEAFVQRLLSEGAKLPCDDSVQTFCENANLPPFYNEASFKRGQKFFHDNIFALLYGKFLGLLSVLAIPSILRILIHTRMSGSPLAAYRRYLSTFFHMYIWYEKDFTPESKLWRSVMEVKNKHKSASQRSFSCGLGRISQKDMVLTQFGFMGYALANREEIGLYNVDEEDLRSFVHVWRVIGFLMGIEDRFNICRDSVAETTDLCRLIAKKAFKPAFDEKQPEFIEMSTYLADGMWSMNPMLCARLHLNLANRLLEILDTGEAKDELFIKLSFRERLWYKFYIFTMWTLQFRIAKLYHNYVQYLSFWLMKVCPFLGYYQFGYENSHVRVLEDVNEQ